jgi:hypothetical protein
MDTTWPPASDRSVLPMVAVVLPYCGGPLTGLRFTSWKQWPAVSTHWLDTSAPEQALS